MQKLKWFIRGEGYVEDSHAYSAGRPGHVRRSDKRLEVTNSIVHNKLPTYRNIFAYVIVNRWFAVSNISSGQIDSHLAKIVAWFLASLWEKAQCLDYSATVLSHCLECVLSYVPITVTLQIQIYIQTMNNKSFLRCGQDIVRLPRADQDLKY